MKIRDEVLNGEINGAAVLNMFLTADSELQDQECVCVCVYTHLRPNLLSLPLSLSSYFHLFLAVNIRDGVNGERSFSFKHVSDSRFRDSGSGVCVCVYAPEA